MVPTRLERVTEQSQTAFKAAQRLIPGGVNASWHASPAGDCTMPVIAKAGGALFVDVDGNEYVDYACSRGSLILGHAEERVVASIGKAAAKGCSFSAPCETEIRLAELVVSRVPAVQMVRLVTSSTEAEVSVLRLARAHTGRSKIIKFQSGPAALRDTPVASAGAETATDNHPKASGTASGGISNPLTPPYNDLDAAARIFDDHDGQIAAVFLEPIATDIGLVAPADGFLDGLRTLCDQHESLLILDETTTGFRVAPGGAGALFDVQADLVCLGGVLGGGLPLAAYGGRKDIMQRMAPAGDVAQAGRSPVNPLAVAAGIATLQATAEEGFYDALNKKAAKLDEGLRAAAAEATIPSYHACIGSIVSLIVNAPSYEPGGSAPPGDMHAHGRFFRTMLDSGVYIPTMPRQPWFVSSVHTDEQIEHTIGAAREAFRSLGD